MMRFFSSGSEDSGLQSDAECQERPETSTSVYMNLLT